MKDNISRLPCYIINLVTGTRIAFTVIPEDISDSNSAQFDDQSIRGRSTPLKGYSGSGPRSVSYSLDLHDDYCQGGILKTVNKLKALVYPVYGGVVTPPKCYVRLGNMVGMTAVTNSVNISWKPPYRNGVYVCATVSLEFSEVVKTPYGATDIEKGGDYLIR